MRGAHSHIPNATQWEQQKRGRECVDGHADDTDGMTRYGIIVNVAKVS